MTEDDILKLNGISAWLTSVLATKSMLCNYGKWVGNSRTLSKLWTLKMIDGWHQLTLRPMEHYLIQGDLFWHHSPSFAKTRVFSSVSSLNRLNALPDDKNRACELHLLLLTEASQSLLNLVRAKCVPQQTEKEIQSWFALMRGCPMMELATQATKNKLLAILGQYRNGEANDATREGHGQDSFRHEMLLIHISHMVKFACKPLDKGKETKVKCDPEHYIRWSEAAGDWHADKLNFGLAGACLPDDGTDGNWSENQRFAMIELPTSMLHNYIDRTNESPNVLALHEEILQRMASAITQSKRTNPEDDNKGGNVYFSLMDVAFGNNNKLKKALMSRRKNWLHRVRKIADGGGTYHPKRPEMLMNDRFIMGRQSYHYIIMNGTQQPFQWHGQKGTNNDHNNRGRHESLGRLPPIPDLQL